MKPALNILVFLESCYPTLSPLFHEVGQLPRLAEVKIPVAESITQITIGQMLSGSAAKTIYGRVLAASKALGLDGSWQLSEAELKSFGVSGRKIKTIKCFGLAYEANPERYEQLRRLSTADLFFEVNEQWGLSDWSASMLGIFYFANEDIYPSSDGSLRRAIHSLDRAGYLNGDGFVSANAAPFRSYLALYLWSILDRKVLKESQPLSG